MSTTPHYTTDAPPAALVVAMMQALGFPGDEGARHDDLLAIVTRRTVLAYFAAGQDTYSTPGGGRKAKTRPQREAEAHAYRTLRLILADLDDQPFGMTEFAVDCAIIDAHNAAADRLENAR